MMEKRKTKNRLTVTVLVLFAALGAFFLTAFTNPSARAQSSSVWGTETGVIRESQDVAVTYDFDLLHSRFAPFAYAEGKTDMKGVYNAMKPYNDFMTWGPLQQTDIYKNPVLLETKQSGASAEGAKVSLGKYTGLFSILANPVLTSYVSTLDANASFPISNAGADGNYSGPQIVKVSDKFNGKNGLTMDGRDANQNEYIDFTEFSVIFNDLQNAGTYFKMTFRQGTGNNSAVTVAFKTAEMTEEQTGTMKNWNNFSGGFSNGTHHAFGIVFNPLARTVEMGTSRFAKYNLYDDSVGVSSPANPNNGKSPNLTSFEEGAMSADFEVEIQFNGFADTPVKDFWREGVEGQPASYERRGRLAVYSINSQELLGDPALLAERESGTYREQYVWADVRDEFEGNDYAIPKLKRHSYLFGESEVSKLSGIGVKEKKSGAAVARNGYTIPKSNLVAGKDYVLTYDFKNLKNDVRSASFDFCYLADTEKPEILLTGSYDAYYPVGTQLTLLQPEITDNSGKVAGSSVSVLCGETPVEVSDGKITLAQTGAYKVIYTASDAKGNEERLEYRFDAYEVTLPQVRESEIAAEPFSLPKATVGAGLSVSVNVYQKGNSAALAEDVTEYTFTAAGTYLFEYVVKNGAGERIDARSIEYTFTDTTDPVVEIQGNIGAYYEAGASLTLPDFTATDNATVLLDKGVSVTLGTEELEIVDGKVSLNRTGTYTVIYYAEDYSEHRTEEILTFQVWKLELPTSAHYVPNGREADLPSAEVSSPMTLRSELFAASDTEFVEALTSEGAYLFECAGDYVMRFTVLDGNTEVASKTFAFTVQETTLPELSLPAYEESYTVGDRVTIQEAVASNNSDAAIRVDYKVFLDGTDITASVQDGVLTVDRVGVYKIVYTAQTFDGKSAEGSVEFRAEEPEKTGCGTVGSFGDTVALAAILAASAVSLLFLRKRKFS